VCRRSWSLCSSSSLIILVSLHPRPCSGATLEPLRGDNHNNSSNSSRRMRLVSPRMRSGPVEVRVPQLKSCSVQWLTWPSLFQHTTSLRSDDHRHHWCIWTTSTAATTSSESDVWQLRGHEHEHNHQYGKRVRCVLFSSATRALTHFCYFHRW
jgi:hypothetical protein